jgi:hypothetical protein
VQIEFYRVYTCWGRARSLSAIASLLLLSMNACSDAWPRPFVSKHCCGPDPPVDVVSAVNGPMDASSRVILAHPSSFCRTATTESVHTSRLRFCARGPYEEPHARAQCRRCESVERSCRVDVDGVGTGASWVRSCHFRRAVID